MRQTQFAVAKGLDRRRPVIKRPGDQRVAFAPVTVLASNFCYLTGVPHVRAVSLWSRLHLARVVAAFTPEKRSSSSSVLQEVRIQLPETTNNPTSPTPQA